MNKQSSFLIVLEGEPEPQPITAYSYRIYRHKLGLLTQIHKEIADKVNSKREALESVCARVEDRYIPEDGTSLRLLMDTIEANPVPAIPNLP